MSESREIRCTRSQVPFNTCANTYRTTHIGGQARVILGDVYINHLCQENSLFASPLHHTGLKHCNVLNSTIKTKRHRIQYHVVPWLVRMTRESTTRKSSAGTERSFYCHLLFFGRYMVYMGICIEPTGDLRLYRPRLRNIVAEDSKFISACRCGDLSTVRSLLSKKMASPHDVTPDNLSALFFAITGGHEHIVQELLTSGADTNQSFGPNQSSPLAWALYKRNIFLVRLLIQQGGCLQHVSRIGWSLLFYLWDTEENPQPSCLEFLQVLQTTDPDLFRSLDSYSVDNDGWVLFNRVACLGTPDELNFLIECGADMYYKNEFDWNALFDAVYGGKLRNVQRLVSLFPGFVGFQDTRGWTLLHVAAEEGHDDIVRYLLSQGADWQATSWPSYTDVPEALRGISCTPLEAARAQREDRAQRFVKIVADYARNQHYV